MQRDNFEGMTSGFSDTPPSTVPNGADVGVAPHAVDQRSDRPATEAVKFQSEKNPWQPLRCGLS